jgi:hypothetical protein
VVLPLPFDWLKLPPDFYLNSQQGPKSLFKLRGRNTGLKTSSNF